MKLVALLALCLASLNSCQSTTVREIARYSHRPLLDAQPCISNGDGTCYEVGELRNTVNMFCTDSYKWDEMQKHLENMEYFYWKCKKYGKCK